MVLDNIFKHFQDEEIDIYSTCFKTVVGQIGQENYHLILSLSLPILIKFLKTESSSTQCSEESLEILSLLLRKFGAELTKNQGLISVVNDESLANRIYGMSYFSYY